MPWVPLPAPSRDEQADISRFKKKARFVVDECLGVEVAEVLVELGWNTVWAGDVGLNGHSDEDVFSFAWRERRIILTHDEDFWNDRFPFHRNPGVVILPDAGPSVLLRALSNMLTTVGRSADLYEGGKLRFSGDGTLVVRSHNRAEGKVVTVKFRTSKHLAEVWED